MYKKLSLLALGLLLGINQARADRSAEIQQKLADLPPIVKDSVLSNLMYGINAAGAGVVLLCSDYYVNQNLDITSVKVYNNVYLNNLSFESDRLLQKSHIIPDFHDEDQRTCFTSAEKILKFLSKIKINKSINEAVVVVLTGQESQPLAQYVGLVGGLPLVAFSYSPNPLTTDLEIQIALVQVLGPLSETTNQQLEDYILNTLSEGGAR